MRRACSILSSWAKPRSLLTLARTASALKCTPFRRGTSMLASVVLPAPGRPMINTFFASTAMSVPLLLNGCAWPGHAGIQCSPRSSAANGRFANAAGSYTIKCPGAILRFAWRAICRERLAVVAAGVDRGCCSLERGVPDLRQPRHGDPCSGGTIACRRPGRRRRRGPAGCRRARRGRRRWRRSRSARRDGCRAAARSPAARPAGTRSGCPWRRAP